MDLSEPRVMGILNATPDSFYAGSRRQTEAEIEERAERITAEGGDIIDVGAYSTRPGAAKVTAGEEMTEDAYREPSADDVPPMFSMVARLGVAYVLMSSRPNVFSIMQDFAPKVQLLRDLGQKDIILDPGFGFGKTLEENYALLARLDRLQEMGLPVLVGASRKSMISRLLGTDAGGSLNGTTVVDTIALAMGGASILRVHDVRECAEVVKICRQTSSL